VVIRYADPDRVLEGDALVDIRRYAIVAKADYCCDPLPPRYDYVAVALLPKLDWVDESRLGDALRARVC
jgi:hypothetical protein